jgi:EF-P beta-lysylation protein EpmB
MRKKDPSDPLLLQVLPLAQENLATRGFAEDPLQEKQFNPLPGLLHKYQSRVLLTLTAACPINCRYCFRRHFAYEDNQISAAALDNIISYIQQKPEINEVILSGGEPLLLKDKKLAQMITQLETIAHVKILRIHTRMPVVLPARINDSFIAILKASRFFPILVIHANHPDEIDADVIACFKRLKDAGILLLHQAVLLKNINDKLTVLKTLLMRLFENAVMPYYLHLLDPVAGTAHFLLSHAQAKDLQTRLTLELPGYLVPKFVSEIAGAKSKTAI